VCLALAAAACGGSPQQPPAPITNPVDPATAGSIAGTVTLTGVPPARQPIRMSSDPYCAEQREALGETVVTGAGGALQNVFVYVRDGLGDLKFPVPQTPVVLDQERCRYAPRVVGVQAGQPLEIRNSDNALHNVHAVPKLNGEFNRSQALKGMADTHVFSVREVMVPFKCDVHSWMTAYVGVLDHPFHAVTGPDGSFTLSGLPPGTYTIEAWHEKLGTRTETVTLGATETQTLAIAFTI
jgi:plastocyanin